MTAKKSELLMVCPRCWGHKHPFCDKCENTGKIPDVVLSRNFTLAEFVRSNTATVRRISNDPTVKHMDRIVEFTRNLMQPLRNEVGPIDLTSGFRSPELNAVIGGSSKTSAHMAAYAADTQPRLITLDELMLWFYETKLPFDQAILEHDKHRHWVHIGYKHPTSGAFRRELLVNDNGKWSNWARR